MRHAIRAARALAFVSAAACSACGASDTSPALFDFDPDTGAIEDFTDDASLASDTDVADASDASIVETGALDSGVDSGSADVYQDSWHAFDSMCFVDAPADADDGDNEVAVDAADAHDADVFVSAPRTCVCFDEDPMKFPCFGPCITALENEGNGCAAGPLPPPDLPSAGRDLGRLLRPASAPRVTYV